jgi:hypothetical protein
MHLWVNGSDLNNNIERKITDKDIKNSNIKLLIGKIAIAFFDNIKVNN